MNASLNGIMACSGEGYDRSRYLAYCNASSYGDFDRGAFWFPLLADATAHAQSAQVLFLGSSRMQFGFSSDALTQWFGTRDIKHYLLGFTHSENTGLFKPLLERLAPDARALVINVDGFFEHRETSPTRRLRSEPDILTRYRTKLRWQRVHRFVCGRWSGACGDEHTIFRDRDDGHWMRFGTEAMVEAAPTIANREGARAEWKADPGLADEFLAGLSIPRSCILLTVVPSPQTPLSEARWLAEELGLDLIEPVVDALNTYDGSHLDQPSAERWSEAFLSQAGGRLEQCMQASSIARAAS